MDDFLKQLNSYYSLSEETADALKAICKIHSFKKNDLILRAGDMARYYYYYYYYYYYRKGLLGYYIINESDNTIFKLFFEENIFVASTSAIVENKPSLFSIVALEDCELVMYPAQVFRELLIKYHDLALFHIHYLEKNWVVKKSLWKST